jgi:hypothetical protein
MNIGDTYGRIIVISEADPVSNGIGKTQKAVRVRCIDCSKEKIVAASDLRTGRVKSCTCNWSRIRKGVPTYFKHGDINSGTYSSWAAMKSRCLNPNDSRYKDYGGRGIKICDRWMDYRNFLADMGSRPEGLTLEREEVNGNYELSNCRWATQKEQRANQRKT